MPAVFLHGVPDTASMWSPLLDRLSRADVVTLSLPGFGTELPPGLDATKEAYADWVTEQLVELGEPVDLVGHDWGCILVQRVASTRPDLVRTLACGSGPIDVDYEWHAMARLWQTPGAGEELIATFESTPAADRVAMLVAGGAPEALAREQVEHMDARMGACIFSLYRSAVTVGAEWQPAIDAMQPQPSLVLWGADDPYVAPRFGECLAARLGGELVVFDDCSHWWPWERAEASAAALERLWAST
ncbi:MAG: alpha/beta hydrolase [Actinobacteria bacterium]|nr:alpha/beta hydrolase [Actinomycetota bacterium]